MRADLADELELLFGEAAALAAALRDASRRGPAAPALSAAGRAVLQRLEEGGEWTVPQLARQRGTSRQSMQVLVDRLAAAQWLDYVANPDHQRSERLRLTDTGRQALEAALSEHAAWLAELLPHLTERSLRTSVHQLRQIRALLQPPAGHPSASPLPETPRQGAPASEVAVRRNPTRRAGSSRARPARVRSQGDGSRPTALEASRPEPSGGVEQLPVTLL